MIKSVRLTSAAVLYRRLRRASRRRPRRHLLRHLVRRVVIPYGAVVEIKAVEDGRHRRIVRWRRRRRRRARFRVRRLREEDYRVDDCRRQHVGLVHICRLEGRGVVRPLHGHLDRVRVVKVAAAPLAAVAVDVVTTLRAVSIRRRLDLHVADVRRRFLRKRIRDD